MENLEDAVALFSPRGDLIFSNAAMRALAIPSLPASHPARQLVERTLAGRKSQGPIAVTFSETGGRAGGHDASHDPPEPERMLMSHAIEDTNGRFLGAMLVARNLGYLTQVHSTLNYSRKLAALGRLMTGVAHEVKNPLNAMTIHLELLKQKLAAVPEVVTVPAGPGGSGRGVDLSKHVHIISSEIRRLDEVVNGFLKFARPDELKLQPVQLATLISDVVTTAMPEAEARGVTIRTECASTLPEINADPGMLGQALLNLAINACQAMPNGGRCASAAGPRTAAASSWTSRTRGSGSRPSISRASSTCTSRPRKRGAGSACPWCTASSSSTMARWKCSRRPGTDPVPIDVFSGMSPCDE